MRLIPLVLTSLALNVAFAFAAGAPRTVGDYAGAMNAVAEKLDLQLTVRQRAADAASAQRLSLVAAMIRRASAEFRSAEQEHIVENADTLPAPVKARLDAAFALTLEAERRAAPEPRFVDEAHANFNAFIDALPVKTPHPTLYGLMSNDLADAQNKLGADVVIYGDRLIDPLYGESPSVRIADTDLPAAALHVTAGRIDVTLPPQAKAAVRFDPPPCEPRPSFGLRVHDNYAQAHGLFWPLVWHTRVETNADLYALASPVMFEARIEAAAETSATQSTTQEFRRRSQFAVADCERNKTVQIEFAAPEGASDIVCKAEWTDAAGQTATSGQCERSGGILRASGVLTGLATVCSPDKLCACAAHSQGVLEISGSYQVPTTASGLTPVSDLVPLEFPAGGLARRTLAAARLRHIKLDFARRGCPILADNLEITPGEDASGVAVSKSGAFRAVFQDGQLSVGSAEAFAPEIGRAP